MFFTYNIIRKDQLLYEVIVYRIMSKLSIFALKMCSISELFERLNVEYVTDGKEEWHLIDKTDNYSVIFSLKDGKLSCLIPWSIKRIMPPHGIMVAKIISAAIQMF